LALLNGLADEAADDAELWNEFDDDEADAAASSASDESSSDDDEQDTGDDAADDGDEFEESETGSADQQDSQPAASGSDARASDHNAGESDLFANATPEQKAAFEAANEKLRKLEQSDRSQRGRVSALSRRLEELQRAKPQGPAPAAYPQSTSDDDPENDTFLNSEDWSSFKDEYPEVAGPIGNIIGQLQAQVANQGKRLSAIGEDRTQEALLEQRALLEESHSDWEDVVRGEGFQPWLAEQPRYVQEAVVRNANDIVDAVEAADIIGRFKASHPDLFGTSQHGGSPSGDSQGNGSGRRARQVTSARSGRPSGGPGVATGIPEDGDEQAIWKAFDKQDEQKARRRA
jgi:hypothetical protein